MGRRPQLPARLLQGPFTLNEAMQAGLSRSHMRSSSWVRLAPSTFLWRGLEADPIHNLEAARLRLPRGFAFSGLTAAWLHGIDVPPCSPLEVSVPKGLGVSARAGMAIRRSQLRKGDVVNVRGMPATSLVRTVAEICSRLALVEAVVVADAALHSGRLRRKELAAWADVHRAHRGVRNLRDVLAHAEPSAESPMESRLRMLLVLAGLPRPQSQVPLHDRWGRFLGRLDLYYEDVQLGIEYDGAGHRERLTEDNRRQNRLLNSGVRLLRFTAADVLGNPGSVVSAVRSAMAESGMTPSSAGTRTSRVPRFGSRAGTRA